MRFWFGPTARRRLFGLAAAVSFLLCHAVCILRASDLGGQYIDAVQWSRWSYHGPPQEGEFRSSSVLVCSYSGTLRVDGGEVRYGPAYLDTLPPHKRAYFDSRPKEPRWGGPARTEKTVWGELAPPGFDAEHRVWSIKPGHRAERWFLAVRTWLAAALLAILPAAWLCLRLKARRRIAVE